MLFKREVLKENNSETIDESMRNSGKSSQYLYDFSAKLQRLAAKAAKNEMDNNDKEQLKSIVLFLNKIIDNII